MYTFFVLGLVPGTNFQITFNMWLLCVEALLLAFFLYISGRHLVQIGNKGLRETDNVRFVLPATRLRR